MRFWLVCGRPIWGGPGEAEAAGRALEFLVLGWFSLRQSRTMCPTLGSGFAYGGAGRAGEGKKAALGRGSAAGPWDAPWLPPLLAFKARGCAGVGELPARTRVPLPSVPSQGDVCTEMVALHDPGAELEVGTFSLCICLVSKEQEKPTVQLGAGFGAFFLSMLPILGPVLPFGCWFDPGALAIPPQAPVPSVQHPPWSGVSDTPMLFVGVQFKPRRELARSFGRSLSTWSLHPSRPLRDRLSVLRPGPGVEPEAAAGGAAFQQPLELLPREPGWKLFNSCRVSHGEPGFQSSLAPM